MIRTDDKDCVPYIGSTTRPYLSQRMDTHRRDYKRWKEGKKPFNLLFDVFEKYGVENCYIELIQAFSCDSNDELRARERRWINDIRCINYVSPFV